MLLGKRVKKVRNGDVKDSIPVDLTCPACGEEIETIETRAFRKKVVDTVPSGRTFEIGDAVPVAGRPRWHIGEAVLRAVRATTDCCGARIAVDMTVEDDRLVAVDEPRLYEDVETIPETDTSPSVMRPGEDGTDA